MSIDAPATTPDHLTTTPDVIPTDPDHFRRPSNHLPTNAMPIDPEDTPSPSDTIPPPADPYLTPCVVLLTSSETHQTAYVKPCPDIVFVPDTQCAPCLIYPSQDIQINPMPDRSQEAPNLDEMILSQTTQPKIAQPITILLAQQYYNILGSTVLVTWLLSCVNSTVEPTVIVPTALFSNEPTIAVHGYWNRRKHQ